MPQDELGYAYLRRGDGGNFIIVAWFLAAGSLISAAIGAVTRSYDAMLLAGALGSFWAVFFITGYVCRAIYFVAGDAEKPRTRSETARKWGADQGYNRVQI